MDFKKYYTKKNLLIAFKIFIFLLIFSIILYKLFPFIASTEFKSFAEKYYFLGAFIILSYVVLSHVFPPFVVFPMSSVALPIYGVFVTNLIFYFSGVISSIICFFISRKYGRGLVKKLAGHDTLKQIDDVVESSGTLILIIGRSFGSSIFEVISYAFGLTKMSFKKYFLITLVFSIIPNIFFAFIFQNTDFNKVNSIFAWIISVFLFGAIFSILFYKIIRNNRNSKN